jgi:hypothetical protein
MIPRTNTIGLSPRFPFRSTRSRPPLLAVCTMVFSLVACGNRESADATNLKRDSASHKIMTGALDAEHSTSSSSAIAGASVVQGAGTAAARTIKSCRLPPPGTKPACNRT